MRSKNKPNFDYDKLIQIILIIILVALSILVMYAVITISGPSWDLIVRYLDGKTILNAATHNITLQQALAGEFSNNLLYYFEPYREPISSLVFAFLTIFFQNSIFPYLVVIPVIYAIAVLKFSKELGIDAVIGLSAFFNSYFIYFAFLLNGGEALSMIFVFAALIMLLRKSPLSGLLIGMAVLSKYPAIILLPLVLLLDSKKKIAYALLLGFFVISLWGIFDYLIYGIPFYSYFASLSTANITSSPTVIYPGALFSVLAYPAMLAAIGCAVLLLKKEKIIMKIDYTSKILIAFILLTAIGYIAVLPHNDFNAQARYGYLFVMALMIPITMLLSRQAKTIPNLKYLVALISIAILVYALYSTLQLQTYQIENYNPNYQGNLYNKAGAELNQLGFTNCRFISNAWVPMIYSGYDAYSPFILYTNTQITPFFKMLSLEEGLNYSTYLQQQKQYPIIVFKYVGVPNSLILNLNSSKIAYSDQNVSIYLPENASCYENLR